MLTKDFLPALSDYAAQEADKAMAVKNFIPEASTAEAAALVGKLTSAYESISSGVKALDKEIQTVSGLLPCRRPRTTAAARSWCPWTNSVRPQTPWKPKSRMKTCLILLMTHFYSLSK